MRQVRVVSKTIRDNTGIIIEIPALLIYHNGEITPLWSLHEYLIKNQLMSNTWHNINIWTIVH